MLEGLAGEDQRGAPPASRIPPMPVLHGRRDELTLSVPSAGRPLVICGIPGVGKSSLAAAVVHRAGAEASLEISVVAFM